MCSGIRGGEMSEKDETLEYIKGFKDGHAFVAKMVKEINTPLWGRLQPEKNHPDIKWSKCLKCGEDFIDARNHCVKCLTTMEIEEETPVPKLTQRFNEEFNSDLNMCLGSDLIIAFFSKLLKEFGRDLVETVYPADRYYPHVRDHVKNVMWLESEIRVALKKWGVE